MSEEYSDFLIKWFTAPTDGACISAINSRFRVEYARLNDNNLEKIYGYSSVPALYSFCDTSAVNATGSLYLQNNPYTRLTGSGVIVGIIDTGIDYTNPVFSGNDGRTRIISIWDQTNTVDKSPDLFSYGAEFTRDDIQNALSSSTPLPIYDGLGNPSGTKAERTMYEKTFGHGTFMAGIAAGRNMGESFASPAPESLISVVKLKPAKKNLRDYYLVPDDAAVVSEADIMTGIRYLVEQARIFTMPLVIYIGVGTNQGDHEGSSILAEYIAFEGSANGIAVVAPAGNEALAGHHFHLDEINSDYTDAEILINQNCYGIYAELWSGFPREYEVEIIAPNGESSRRISSSSFSSEYNPFKFINSSVNVSYQMVTRDSLKWLCIIKIKSPVAGNWRIRIYKNGIQGHRLDIWLPTTDMLTSEARFTTASTHETITEPANRQRLITVGAYNHIDNSSTSFSGRGYSVSGAVKPEISAPGADIYGPLAAPYGNYEGSSTLFTRRSGTSVAAALTAGCVAQLLEWGVIQKNMPLMNTNTVAGLLATGAASAPTSEVPDPEWGYGKLDLYGAIEKAY